MSDVWRELMERLKQKAKSDAEIKRCMHLTEEQMQTIHKLPPKEIQNYLDKLSQETKWVRLEDVRKELQQLKQTHILISKDWLNKRLEEERMRTKFIDASDSHQAIGKIDLILEILREANKG